MFVFMLTMHLGCGAEEGLHAGIPPVEVFEVRTVTASASRDLLVYPGQVGTKVQETFEHVAYYEWEYVDALEPVVFHEDGSPAPVEPVYYRGEVAAWRAVDGFSVGSHRVWVGYTPAQEVVGFTVGDFGIETEFDPSALEGRTFELVGEWPSVLGWEAALVLNVTPLYLEVLGASATDLEFRIWSDGSAGRCQVLESAGELSEQGLLTWQLDEVELTIEPGPIWMHELSLEVGLQSSELGAAGLKFEAIADLRPIVDLWQEKQESAADAGERDPPVAEELCSLLVGAYGGCEPCPDDGDRACVKTMLFNGQLTEVSDVVVEGLDNCGLSIGADDLPVFGCDVPVPEFSCRTAAGRTGPWLIGLAMLVGVRRREHVSREMVPEK